jgi:hypothetical protein
MEFRVLGLTWTIDPAGSSARKSDESAIVVTGYARGASIAFALDSWSGRVVTSDLIDKAIELAVKALRTTVIPPSALT